MATELYINDQLVDILGTENISADYAMFKIEDVSSRSGARSYSFVLPKTSRNKTVLENPEVVSNLSKLPYQKMKARCFVDGIDVLIRYVEIVSVSNAYTVRLYGFNSDIWIATRDLFLRDLDLKQFDHFWNFNNILDSRFNDVNDLYIYPIIDLNSDSPNLMISDTTNRNIGTKCMLPFFYVDFLLHKVMENVGYTFINDFQNSLFYSSNAKLIIAPVDTLRNEDAARYNVRAELSNAGFTTFETGIFIKSNVLYTERNFFTLGTTPNINNGFMLFADNQIKVRVKIRGWFSNYYLGVTAQVNIIVRVSDSINGTYSFYPNRKTKDYIYTVVVPPNTFGNEQLEDMDFGYIIMDAYELDNMFIGIHGIASAVGIGFENGAGNAGMPYVDISEAEILDLRKTLYTPNVAYTNEYLTMNSMLPNMKQSEFIKAYMQMFFLLPVKSDIDRTISFVEFSAVVKNLSKAYDWSDKIDYSVDYSLSYILEEYGQKNNFKYADEDGEIKPTGTDGILFINNNRLEDEKDILGLPYSATNTVRRLNYLMLNQIGIFENEVFVGGKNPRILLLEKKESSDLNPAGHITYFDTLNSQNIIDSLPLTWFISDNKQYNLGFENNLLPLYYEVLKNILENVKILTLNIRLSAADISTIDFTRPIYLQQHESYFYLSSIKSFSFTESKSTIVELVKLNI